MARVLAFAITIFVFLSASQTVLAAKPRVAKSSSSGGGAVYVGGSYSTAKLSRGTNSIIVNFINLGNASKASYTLSYASSGISQGVVGSLAPTGASESRDLYFGTCSHGTCTPHYNIKNARLVVITYLKSGARNAKLYRINW